MLDKREAKDSFNVIFKTADPQFPIANQPGHLDGTCKVFGGIKFDQNFNTEQRGIGSPSQTGFNGDHGIPI